jgi:hypothetical protein
MSRAPLYVPESYVCHPTARAELWTHAAAPTDHTQRLARITQEALAALEELLGVTPRRRLHLCCYATNREARDALEREVSPDMALAPFSGDAESVIVVQSPRSSPRNADEPRLLRLIAHEISHQLVAEVTGSRKRLGDSNRDEPRHAGVELVERGGGGGSQPVDVR